MSVEVLATNYARMSAMSYEISRPMPEHCQTRVVTKTSDREATQLANHYNQITVTNNQLTEQRHIDWRPFNATRIKDVVKDKDKDLLLFERNDIEENRIIGSVILSRQPDLDMWADHSHETPWAEMEKFGVSAPYLRMQIGSEIILPMIKTYVTQELSARAIHLTALPNLRPYYESLGAHYHGQGSFFSSHYNKTVVVDRHVLML